MIKLATFLPYKIPFAVSPKLVAQLSYLRVGIWGDQKNASYLDYTYNQHTTVEFMLKSEYFFTEDQEKQQARIPTYSKGTSVMNVELKL